MGIGIEMSKKEELRLRLQNIGGSYSLGVAKYAGVKKESNRKKMIIEIIEKEDEDAVIEIEKMQAEWGEEIAFEKQEKEKKHKEIDDLKKIIEDIKKDSDLKPYQRKLYALLIGEMVTK